jgi:hypothetical protein
LKYLFFPFVQKEKYSRYHLSTLKYRYPGYSHVPHQSLSICQNGSWRYLTNHILYQIM